jgi:hypothetical protein
MNANNLHPNYKLQLFNVYAMASVGVIKLLGLAKSNEETNTWCDTMVVTLWLSTFLFGGLPFLYYSFGQLFLLEKIILFSHLLFLLIGLVFYRLHK